MRIVVLFAVVSLACGDRRAAPSATQVGDDDNLATTSGPQPAPARSIMDAHIHLTTGSEAALIEALDRANIDRAVILATPHLDPDLDPSDETSDATPVPGASGETSDELRKKKNQLLAVAERGETSLRGYQQANVLVLAAAAAHPDRLIPFVTLDLGTTEVGYLAELLGRGACGVKVYQGHRSFHRRPIDHESHRAIFSLLAERGTPVLLHVNTVHFRDELASLIRRYRGKLNMVCPHFCGSRTDIDRLQSILTELPGLLVDTSHGPGAPGAAGFAHIESQRERVRRLMEANADRFLFGSDLVTSRLMPTWVEEWNLQIRGNLEFLTADTFKFWRQPEGQRIFTVMPYQGLALSEATLASVTGDNARRWLAGCP